MTRKMTATTRTVKSARLLIKDLDNCYELHPNKDYVKGMIMGLAHSIYGNCDKPKCISDRLWDNLQKECQEEYEDAKKYWDKVSRQRNPKTIYDILEEPEEVI